MRFNFKPEQEGLPNALQGNLRELSDQANNSEDPLILHLLSLHPNTIIQGRVARNRNIHPQTFRVLLDTNNPHVLRNLLQNPNLKNFGNVGEISTEINQKIAALEEETQNP